MKPSEKCKEAGLSSLKELGEITRKSVSTLRDWDKREPRLFEILLIGAVKFKKGVIEMKSHKKSNGI